MSMSACCTSSGMVTDNSNGRTPANSRSKNTNSCRKGSSSRKSSMSLLSTRSWVDKAVEAPATNTHSPARTSLCPSVHCNSRNKVWFQNTPVPWRDTAGGGASTITAGSKVKAKT